LKFTIDPELNELFKKFNNSIDTVVEVLRPLKVDYYWEMTSISNFSNKDDIISNAKRYCRLMKISAPKNITLILFDWSMLFTLSTQKVIIYVICDDHEKFKKQVKTVSNMMVFL